MGEGQVRFNAFDAVAEASAAAPSEAPIVMPSVSRVSTALKDTRGDPEHSSRMGD
eukprot:CAMPEP_0206320654 /NCGR_PEP_ID=MMETSP0106_2-20121207/18442_1 /ASSEMBLY_ACC=CAM_ASM_000206 /TAXON_ID=81532 /ORGANISM="Acanthoeca-like sp., Strain 10tr" /LENGTH=54 /DNA_ID=CAMNT_0053752643 /DNA_START=97 /DNA_END=258 /DNA_ORIENTATION=+